MDTNKLQLGFALAKKITKKFAKTFYLSSLFLPKNKKNASYAVYAICRLSDESVDQITCLDQENELQKLASQISTAYSQLEIQDPLLIAFRYTINNYNIPKEYFDALIDGMRMDLEIKRYANFSMLEDYCYKVAGVVGLIMLKIFENKDNAAYDYAIKLGIAMQLTNILRDISEDLGRGRIYLPRDEMLKFNITEEQLKKGQINEEFKNFMRFQITRNEEFYTQSQTGIKFIDSRLCRFVILAMEKIYSGILDSIKKNNYNIFTRRAYIDKFEKIKIIIKILWEKKYL